MYRWLFVPLVVLAWAGVTWAEPVADEPGFVRLFDGKTLEGWQGDVKGYVVEDGVLVCKGGKLFTKDEYGDFIFRFEFKVPPGGNNGVGIRTPLQGDPAYVGMEIQILDDDAPRYANLKPYQYCGSIYGVVPAQRGSLKPAGEWNTGEITCKGSQVTVKLNGKVVVDADIAPFADGQTPDGRPHPGLKRTQGYIGFLGHGAPVAFRNVRVKTLEK
ncbi:MAG: DUF1080 domain-containing protein [Gemmataceae bacterium]